MLTSHPAGPQPARLPAVAHASSPHDCGCAPRRGEARAAPNRSMMLHVETNASLRSHAARCRISGASGQPPANTLPTAAESCLLAAGLPCRRGLVRARVLACRLRGEHQGPAQPPIGMLDRQIARRSLAQGTFELPLPACRSRHPWRHPHSCRIIDCTGEQVTPARSSLSRATGQAAQAAFVNVAGGFTLRCPCPRTARASSAPRRHVRRGNRPSSASR